MAQSTAAVHSQMFCTVLTMYLDPADLQNDVNNFTAYAASYFKTHKTYAPLGHDPTFETTSRLWDYNLIAREGEYYNTTTVSQHCFANL